MSLMFRLVAYLLLIAEEASAQSYKFCTDGVAEANFDERESIDVIVAQAPLFSTNPKIGKLAGLISAYHSSLVFAQGSGDARRYWTLEFDNTAPSFLEGVIPTIDTQAPSNGGVSFHWHNDARYCLSKGLKWGREHWSKRFDVVTSMSADQAKLAFTDFLSAVNVTQHSRRPQYQLWRVATTDGRFGRFGHIKKTLIEDTTCNNGVIWFLHYLKSKFAIIPVDFTFKATAVLYRAKKVEAVNIKNPVELEELLHHFRNLADMTAAHKPLLGRLADLVKFVFNHKYVYDNNAGIFYRLHGWNTWWPWPHYVEMPLVAPPWMSSLTAVRQGVVV